ncbi:hypothetical protein ZIOFF_045509 [Zingiber officinale]|uniref:Uncharacterized protein n=1 Tax=Zingiber officinale TaxID=94328 RepID=A0A8J5L149_ZINOF|nr:hypothetical protein ZIOFF_045509 [Zingiber officinale]
MVRKAKVEFDETPPEIDLNNPYADPVAFLDYREHLVREKWIQIETAKIIRDRLLWCYRVEGINHKQKCRHLVEKYLDSTRGIGWGKDARPPEFHGAESFFCVQRKLPSRAAVPLQDVPYDTVLGPQTSSRAARQLATYWGVWKQINA